MRTKNLRYTLIAILLLLPVGFAGCDDDKDKEDNCYIGKVLRIGNVSTLDEGFARVQIVDAPSFATDDYKFPRMLSIVIIRESDLPSIVLETGMLISFKIKYCTVNISMFGEITYVCEVESCK